MFCSSDWVAQARTLVQQRVNNNQDTDAVAMLLELADHPQEDVSALAVAGLLRDDDLIASGFCRLWKCTTAQLGKT